MVLAIIVFVSVFLVAGLLFIASGTGSSKQTKNTLARLDALMVIQDATKDDHVDIRKKELLSAIPFLNRLLLQMEIAPKLRRLLYQANIKWTPGGILLVSPALWLLSSYVIYFKTELILISLVLGLIPGALPLLYVLRKRAARFSKFEENLPAALDLMVNGLRGGHSLVSVMGMAADEAPEPIASELRICFDEQNYGLELRTAVENLALRVPIADVRIVMAAILIQKDTGGNLAEVLDKCAYVIRERFRLKKEIKVKTAQGRLTGWILSLLPLGLGTLLYFMKPEVVSLLWTKPLGVKMLYAGAAMIVIGSLIIRKIVRIRV